VRLVAIGSEHLLVEITQNVYGIGVNHLRHILGSRFHHGSGYVRRMQSSR
jgi:hypothetical protein